MTKIAYILIIEFNHQKIHSYLLKM